MVPCRYPLSLSRFLPRDTLTLFYCSPFIFQIVYAYYSSCEFMLLLLRLDSCKFNQHSKFISFTWSYSYSTSFPSFFFCIEFSLQKPIFRNWKQKECQSSTLTVFDKFDLAGLASSQKVKSSDCISKAWWTWFALVCSAETNASLVGWNLNLVNIFWSCFLFIRVLCIFCLSRASFPRRVNWPPVGFR